MKVLLIKDVKALGKAGEIKEVKDGYGNNFLIGKGFAKAATPDVLRQYEAELAKVSVLIKKPLGANGSLFGAVTKDEIAHELESKHRLIIDKKAIDTDGHIKSTGIYNVDVKLGHGVKAVLKVQVEGE